MSNKQVAELYRQLADKLDEITSLEIQLEIEKQIRETSEEQVRVTDTQIKLLSDEKEDYKAQSESFKLMALGWREKALNRVDLLTVVNRVFNGYTSKDFADLEAFINEAKSRVTSEDFNTMDEYEDEIAVMDNLICLSEELGVIKGEFFDASEGEEDERLKEF